MTQTTVGAYPAKRFFVEMLTRDIELQDAILDLLDNCVDGAMRRASPQVLSTDLPYKGSVAWIEFDSKSFKISDNCGGISRHLAEQSAFHMGRKDKTLDADMPTVGVYGIGMKRAIFKMGQSAYVLSQTAPSQGFMVEISEEWMNNDLDWELPIRDVPDALDKSGTVIEITSLRQGVSRLLSGDTGFTEALEKAISSYYGYIIEKGFSVKLNGKTVVPQQISLLFDENGISGGEGMAPYVYTVQDDGVTVQLIVGIYRDLPNISEEEDALEGKPSTEKAGWTIICNDRVVVHADKTRVTGWGEAGTPSYHTQFVSIAGVVVFRSNDPSKLPITTTKRGIEGNSELYLNVKEYMREGLKIFTSYTNAWKGSSQERAELVTHAKSAHAESIPELIRSSKFKSVRKGLGGQKYVPTLPRPKDLDPMVQVRFARKTSDIRKVSQYLFETAATPPSTVGAMCFDEILEQAAK